MKIFELENVVKASFTPDSRPTYDQCRPIFIVWSGMIGKKITRSDWRAYIYQSPINTRCIHAVSLMHPRSNLALPDQPRPSGWPVPALHDQPPTYSWYNYAHYAQYRNPPPPQSVYLIFTPVLKWRIQANVMPTDSLFRVQYPKCAYVWGAVLLFISKMWYHLAFDVISPWLLRDITLELSDITNWTKWYHLIIKVISHNCDNLVRSPRVWSDIT